MGDVFQFMNLQRNPGDKIAAEVRKQKFFEIYEPLKTADSRFIPSFLAESTPSSKISDRSDQI